MAYDLLLGNTKRDWSCGSILLPEKQQAILMNKIDDVRYDVRKAGNAAKIGLLALSGALGLVAISNIVRSANASQNNGG